jgi:hypothetical protein
VFLSIRPEVVAALQFQSCFGYFFIDAKISSSRTLIDRGYQASGIRHQRCCQSHVLST